MLRKLDFENLEYFECCGKTFYKQSDDISFDRWNKLQEFSLEFGYSMTFIDIFNNLEKIKAFYNKHDYYQMSIVVHNIEIGIKNVDDQKYDPALKICALFLNEKDENIIEYNEAKMKEKIDCWRRELSIRPFFYLAASLVEGFTEAYEKVILSGLPKKEEKEEKSKE